jgi:hypothetical protein
MDQNVPSGSSGNEKNSTDTGNYEWHWWYSMLGATIILAIVFVISR